MDDSPENKDQTLNLGLSDILASDAQIEAGGKQAPAADTYLDIDSLIQSCIDARETAVTSSAQDADGWRALWQSASYDKLTKRAEDTLLADSKNIEARLWWVRSHGALRSMPVSMIAAPAEELFHTIDLSRLTQSERILVSETLGELSQACWDCELFEKAVQFLIRARQIDQSHTARLALFIEAELKRIQLSELPIADRAEAEAYRSRLLILAKEIGVAAANAAATAPDPSGKQAETVRESRSASVFSALLVPVKVLALPVLALSVLAVAGYFGYSAGFSGGTHVPPSVYLPEQQALVQAIPMPGRKMQQEGPTLWNILRRLENDEAGIAQTVGSGGGINLSSGMVNTALPVEPPELARLITAWDQRELVTDSAALRDLDIASGDSGEQEVRGHHIVAGYENLPGTSQPGTGAANAREAKDTMYLITSTTYVYQHPSQDAPSLAQLESGNHVEVSEQLGEWLKIVSAQNRIGYIRASAAAPLSKKSSPPN